MKNDKFSNLSLNMLSLKEIRIYLLITLGILVYGLVSLTRAPLVKLVVMNNTEIAKFNLNQASLEQLMTIVGIGPGTSANIKERREELNGFSNWDDVLSVKGIGPKKLEILKQSTFFDLPKRNLALETPPKERE